MSSVRGPASGLSVFGVVTACCVSLVLGTGHEAATDVDTGSEYTAVFTDASGLTTGSGVRLAGARIGTVTAVDTTDDTATRVEFTVGRDRSVLDTTHAAIRYEGLLGQYYLELFESRPGGTTLAAGATIPQEQTAPNFDVSRLFDGLQPLFTALDIEELGRVARNVVHVLQGDASAIGPVLTDLGTMLQNVTNKHAAIAVLIHNLGRITAEVGGMVEQVAELIERLAGLVGLVEDAVELVHSLFTSDSSLESEGGLLADSESHFVKAHPSLHEQLRELASRPDQLVEVLALKPELITGLNANPPAESPVSAMCSTRPFSSTGHPATAHRSGCR